MSFPHGAAGLRHLDSSQGDILLLLMELLVGVASSTLSGCPASGPPSQPHSEAQEAPLGLSWAELILPAASAMAPPQSRSKGFPSHRPLPVGGCFCSTMGLYKHLPFRLGRTPKGRCWAMTWAPLPSSQRIIVQLFPHFLCGKAPHDPTTQDPIFSRFPFSLSPSFQCRKIHSHA